MVLITVWAAVALCLSTVGHASIVYRMTARSFLPAGCMQTYTQVNNAWNYSVPIRASQVNYPTTGGDAYIGGSSFSYCPIWNDINDGKYNGHPDFEASGNMYQDGCSGFNFSLTSPTNQGRQCRVLRTTDTDKLILKIIENDLVPHLDGLPKPRYCVNNGRFSSDPRCGWIPSGTAKVATTGSFYFDKWYRDDNKYNLRSGFLLPLVNIGGGLFQFASPSSGFFPLATNAGRGLYPCQKTPDRRLDCSNGGKAFPTAQKISANEDADKIFSFTTEHHSFFQLRGTETFTFSGVRLWHPSTLFKTNVIQDDDLWVFLNEKLAVDVGGLHPASNSTISLENPFVRQQLNMEINGTYALDIYHAERHTGESNFRIATGLTGGCNVLQSGKPAYVWNPSAIATDFKLIGGPTWGLVESGRIKLTDGNEVNTASYAYLKQQINVGAGFVITFKFTATPRGEGFVFVLQRDNIVDLNGGSGGNLGFKNTLNSIGIVFDLCTDRDVDPTNIVCANRELRMHYLANGGENSASTATRKWYAPLYVPVNLTDGNPHTVIINYYEKSPPWLEVVVDNDLMLQDRNMSLDQVIGGRNAFAGFTASTGFAASTIQVYDLNISTVAIEDSKTTTINLPVVSASEPLFNVTADGRKFGAIILQNQDKCGGLIEFGGFGNRALGVMTLRSADPDTRRMLQSANATTVFGEIVDTDNGQYSIRFRTTVPGVYDIKVYYGAGCFLNGTNTSPLDNTASSSNCFTYARNQSAVFSPVPPPALIPDSNSVNGLPQSAITGIGVAAGIIGAVGAVMLFVGIRIRNRWRRDKQFIDAGRMAVAERDVTYLGDNDLDALQQRLQATMHAIQAERAKKLREGDKQAVIDELNRQRGELQEQVRRLKIQRDGGDPNEPLPTMTTRIRKSFAASRVSRGISMRLSRGFSMAQTEKIPEDSALAIDPHGTELSSGNPLFNRMSQALGLRSSTRAAATSRAHIDV